MLEWDYLRFMLAVHRGGSMHAAAETLSVDRATVIRRLDALEARLGVRLFERRRDGCILTRAGLDIIGTVEGIAEAMTALEHRVGGEDRRAEGVVSVTVPILPLLAAAKGGLGIAFLPCIAAHGEVDLVPVPPGVVGRPEIFLITHRDLRRSARVRTVYDFIVRLCKEYAGPLAGRAIGERFADRD